jgi:hypothetical protein
MIEGIRWVPLFTLPIKLTVAKQLQFR